MKKQNFFSGVISLSAIACILFLTISSADAQNCVIVWSGVDTFYGEMSGECPTNEQSRTVQALYDFFDCRFGNEPQYIDGNCYSSFASGYYQQGCLDGTWEFNLCLRMCEEGAGTWDVVCEVACADDGDCDDGVACNGAETCVDDVCVAGSSTCSGEQLCDAVVDQCVECLSDSDCDDGVACNGAETCVDNVCVAGSSPCSGGQLCDEVRDQCVECLYDSDCAEGYGCSEGACIDMCVSDADCDDGVFCNGVEACVNELCVEGSPACPVGEVCDETADQCVECLSDSDCDDGVFCNGVEACVNEQCVEGSPACPAGEVCDETADQCVECLSDSDCSVGEICKAAVCTPSADYTYIISDGLVTITGYTGSGGDIVIPDTIEGMPVASIGSEAFQNLTIVTGVTIPDSVASIGEAAFYSCDNLTSVTIGNNVTSIGEQTFAYCSGLTSVTIGNSVTSIGGGAFTSCSSLTNVVIGNSVTSIGAWAFRSCSSLSSITIPDSVTIIGAYAFAYCSSLTSITIPDSVTQIVHHAFYFCTSLTDVTIHDSIVWIGNDAFAYCSSLSLASFLGNAPSMETGVFRDTAPDFRICYTSGATGFATPTWEGYPAAPCACTYDTDCTDYEICEDSKCILPDDDPPSIDYGPYLMAGPWPVLPTDPDNPMILKKDFGVLWTFNDDYASCPGPCTHTAEYQAVVGSGPDESTQAVALTVETDATGEEYASTGLPIEDEDKMQNATTYSLRFAVTDCRDQTTQAGPYYFRVAVTDDPPVLEGGPWLAAGWWPKLARSESEAFVLRKDSTIMWTFSDDYATCPNEICTSWVRYRKLGDEAWTWFPAVAALDPTDGWYASVTLPVTSENLEPGTYQFHLRVMDCTQQFAQFAPLYYFKVAE